MPMFNRVIGIDYSGAQTAESSLPGLRVSMAEADASVAKVFPPERPRRYWTRRGVAEWLLARLSEDLPTLVGLDHGFSFPLQYFEAHGLKPHWPSFLDDFQRHWPTDQPSTYVDFVREGLCGDGAARMGNSRWRRLVDERAGAKSVFHFDVPGSVAKSTHAGLPWLRFLRMRLGERVHFWPFDGWTIPPGCSVIAEAYPSLWNRALPSQARTPDQHDAHCIAFSLARADREGTLLRDFVPELTPSERAIAEVEGWILGLSASGRDRSHALRQSDSKPVTSGVTAANSHCRSGARKVAAPSRRSGGPRTG